MNARPVRLTRPTLARCVPPRQRRWRSRSASITRTSSCADGAARWKLRSMATRAARWRDPRTGVWPKSVRASSPVVLRVDPATHPQPPRSTPAQAGAQPPRGASPSTAGLRYLTDGWAPACAGVDLGGQASRLAVRTDFGHTPGTE
jgi:hypothetical protein